MARDGGGQAMVEGVGVGIEITQQDGPKEAFVVTFVTGVVLWATGSGAFGKDPEFHPVDWNVTYVLGLFCYLYPRFDQAGE